MEEGRGIGAERAAAAWSVERPFRVEADFAVRFVIDLPDQLRRRAVGRPVGLPRHRLGPRDQRLEGEGARRPEEIGRAHSELQSLMRISYAVFCLQTKKNETT